jgi:hypothetical protein
MSEREKALIRQRAYRAAHPGKHAEEERRRRERDPDRYRAMQAARYQANPGLREKALERVRRWNEANPGAAQKRGQEWYETHIEHVAQLRAAWKAANPGKHYASNRAWIAANPERARELARLGADRRRARMFAAFVEDVDRRLVWERDGGLCHICGLAANPMEWHLDHVRALARGGKHSYVNTAVSHPSCNIRKSARV